MAVQDRRKSEEYSVNRSQDIFKDREKMKKWKTEMQDNNKKSKEGEM